MACRRVRCVTCSTSCAIRCSPSAAWCTRIRSPAAARPRCSRCRGSPMAPVHPCAACRPRSASTPRSSLPNTARSRPAALRRSRRGAIVGGLEAIHASRVGRPPTNLQESFMSGTTSEAKPRGLDGVVAAQTRLSNVDGQNGVLIIGGYELKELAGKVTFEEAAHLLWKGRLPSAAEREDLTRAIAAQRALPETTMDLVREAAKKGAPPIDT